ncbi:MAG: hypothetical protein LBM77_10095 [Spirochaetaceae bacterium]|jgi:hypothetical protein|nr:hypothetical protein [Spirochaetaceae bacterium]
MIIFLLLYIPLLTLLICIFNSEKYALIEKRKFWFWNTWALLFGSAIAVFQFLVGDTIAILAYGEILFSHALIDIIIIPCIIPALIYGLIYLSHYLFRKNPAPLGGGLLCWMLFSLIPASVFHAVIWGVHSWPLYLVLVPTLWGAVAIGIPLILDIVNHEEVKLHFKIISIIVLVALPFLAALSWMFFFSKNLLAGSIFLFLSLLPAALILYSPHGIIKNNHE